MLAGEDIVLFYSVARQAPGYASSYVQEKEYHSRAGFQAIWNGTY